MQTSFSEPGCSRNGATGSAARESAANLPSDGSEGASTENDLRSSAALSSFESEDGEYPLGIEKQKTAAAAANAKISTIGKCLLRCASLPS